MKKILTISFVLVMMLILAACQDQEEPAPTAETAVEAEQPTEVPPTEAPPTEAPPTEEPTDVPPTEEPEPEPTEEPAPEEMAEETAETAAPNWEPIDCATIVVDPAVVDFFECGYITVPESRAGDSEATIRLVVARLPTDAPNPGAPIIQGTGGPGGSGFDSTAAAVLQLHESILADRDWVFFSQRGTEHAEPHLDCPAYNTAQVEGGREGWTEEELHRYEVDAIQACTDDFRAQGVDLSAYNTVENAEDINDIRQALGYDQIIFYGESYGTLLGQFLMEAHPEILEAVVLDGVVPRTIEISSKSLDIAGSFEHVAQSCAADPACNAAYPDIRGTLETVMQNISDDPPKVTVPLLDGEVVDMQITPRQAMNGMFVYMYTGGHRTLPLLLDQFSKGDYANLSALIPAILQFSGSSKVMNYAVNCSDDPARSLDQFDLSDVPEVYHELILYDALNYVDFCPIVDVPQLPDASDDPVTADIPVLVLQGAFDPATPVRGGDEVAEALPNSTNVIFPTGGHIQTSSDPCAIAIMDQFISDPTGELDTSCNNAEVAFSVPTQASIASEAGDITMSFELPSSMSESEPFGPYKSYASSNVNMAGSITPAGSEEDAASMIDTIVAEILPFELEESETFAGDPVAGYPSQRLQGTALDPDGALVGVDIITFENEEGRVFWMIFLNLNPSRIAPFREIYLLDILDSLTISGS
jgi:pimeloyl-ACP methyl ester carboxylesterase